MSSRDHAAVVIMLLSWTATVDRIRATVPDRASPVASPEWQLYDCLACAA